MSMNDDLEKLRRRLAHEEHAARPKGKAPAPGRLNRRARSRPGRHKFAPAPIWPLECRWCGQRAEAHP